jgi:hypothetical protein
MKTKIILPADPVCLENQVTRRAFLNQSIAMGAAVVAGGGLAHAAAGKKPSESAETLVTTLYKSLNEEQKKAMAFPFDHPLRSAVDNNWHIVDQRIGQLLDADQQAMVREIFLQIHSEEYRDQVMHQFVSDNRNRKNPSEEAAFASAAVAVFGEPGQGDFEWVFTGRHCTRRCDGNSVAGAAFGGPIFYGHAADGFNEKPDHPGNVYWFQAKRANQVFQMLDGKQRGKALLEGAGREEQKGKTVTLTGKTSGLDGLSVSEMSADQKVEMRKVMDDLLAPFRKEDREEAMNLIQAQFDHLHLAFYKKEDIGDDGVWDVWQVEGPSMVWHFRGSPHVHTWVNVRKGV